MRLLYFPENIYFAYDQARDSFTSLEILKGDFKIVGPPSAASDKLFPGPFIFYIYSPIYFLFDKNPEAIAALLRLYNSLGVVLTFLIASNIFNKRIGILSAFLFAISYEASQYSLFISHQGLAVVTVLVYYLGLSIVIFKKNQRGIILAVLGAGLSIQFHYVYVVLIPILFLLLTIFRQNIKPLNLRIILLSSLIFLATISTYVISEIKFGFRMVSGLFDSGSHLVIHLDKTLFIIKRLINDNILVADNLALIIAISVPLTFLYYLKDKELRGKLIFLLIWFLGGLMPYLLSGTPSYYYSAGIGVSLFIFYSFIAHDICSKNKLVSLILFVLIAGNNLNLILTINKFGPNQSFIIQPGMLISNEKRALDYIYTSAGSQPFAVGALTIPLNVKTTWSYIFEWYGLQKYHFLPQWVGPSAEGYPGNLEVVSDRSRLPETQFLIIEPTVGIREAYKENFFKEEGYFTKVVEERKFETITVQRRQKI